MGEVLGSSSTKSTFSENKALFLADQYARFQGSSIQGSQVQDFQIPRFQGSKMPRYQDSKIPRFQGSKTLRFQHSKGPQEATVWGLVLGVMYVYIYIYILEEG